MAKIIKGLGIFMAQFTTPDPLRNNIDNFTKWALELGFKGLQYLYGTQI